MHIQFRMRTMLVAVALIALAIGGGRWWYDSRMEAHETQRRICMALDNDGISMLWSYEGPRAWDAWKWLDGPLFRQPTQVYCDDAADDAVAEAADHLAQLNGVTLNVLGRQVVPHAHTAERGETSPLIDALQAHPTLRRLVVDATIRGTPVEYDAPLYTREDLALLESLLPNLQIDWIEAN
jgi:hypothetical protein